MGTYSRWHGATCAPPRKRLRAPRAVATVLCCARVDAQSSAEWCAGGSFASAVMRGQRRVARVYKRDTPRVGARDQPRAQRARVGPSKGRGGDVEVNVTPYVETDCCAPCGKRPQFIVAKARVVRRASFRWTHARVNNAGAERITSSSASSRGGSRVAHRPPYQADTHAVLAHRSIGHVAQARPVRSSWFLVPTSNATQ